MGFKDALAARSNEALIDRNVALQTGYQASNQIRLQAIQGTSEEFYVPCVMIPLIFSPLAIIGICLVDVERNSVSALCFARRDVDCAGIGRITNIQVTLFSSPLDLLPQVRTGE